MEHHLKKRVLLWVFLFFCMFVCFVFVFVLVGFILLRGNLSQSFWLSRESIHIPAWPQIHILLPQPPKVLSWLTCTTPPRLWVTICDCSVLSNINLFFTTTEEKKWNSFKPTEWLLGIQSQMPELLGDLWLPTTAAQCRSVLHSSQWWPVAFSWTEGPFLITSDRFLSYSQSNWERPLSRASCGLGWLSHCFERVESL